MLLHTTLVYFSPFEASNKVNNMAGLNVRQEEELYHTKRATQACFNRYVDCQWQRDEQDDNKGALHQEQNVGEIAVGDGQEKRRNMKSSMHL